MVLILLSACKGPATEAPAFSTYEDTVRALAVPRGPGGAGWQAAQDRCATTFEAAGYAVELHTFGEDGVNVIGRKEGASDAAIVVSAHYDSVGGCDGADDNASGVAGVLELATALADVELANDVIFACWDQEERGLLGSTNWVIDDDTELVEAWSFEMIAYASDEPDSQTLPAGFEIVFPDQVAAVEANDNRGDFITFVANEPMAATAATFEGRADAIGLPVVTLLLSDGLVTSPLTADLKRSDHTPFWLDGVPAVMVTDSANFRNDAYHCANGLEDSVDRLDFDFATRVLEATSSALQER